MRNNCFGGHRGRFRAFYVEALKTHRGCPCGAKTRIPASSGVIRPFFRVSNVDSRRKDLVSDPATSVTRTFLEAEFGVQRTCSTCFERLRLATTTDTACGRRSPRIPPHEPASESWTQQEDGSMAKKKKKAAGSKTAKKGRTKKAAGGAGRESLVVGSKVKAYIRAQGAKTSGELPVALSEAVYNLLDQAISRAMNNKRSTVQPKDL